MGNSVCDCSGPSNKGREDKLNKEARDNTSSKRNTLRSPNSQTEECKEMPVKQNKRSEHKLASNSQPLLSSTRSSGMPNIVEDDNYPEIPNGGSMFGSASQQSSGQKPPAMKYNYAPSSAHNINKLVDTDAAKAKNNDLDSDEESISDLSDGFDEDGRIQGFDTKTSAAGASDDGSGRKELLRFQSKLKWDNNALSQHENDILAEMRRLSIVQGGTASTVRQ